MAFNNFLTPVWIAPGATQTWWYTFHDNRGQQFASPDMKTPDAKMWATQQGEQMATGGQITYFVTVHNDGPQWCFYNLHGGGAV